MNPNNFQDSSKHILYGVQKDRQPRYFTLEQDIRVLSAELCRLARLPYRSFNNHNKIRTLDKQIEYLESILAAHEKAQKGFE